MRRKFEVTIDGPESLQVRLEKSQYSGSGDPIEASVSFSVEADLPDADLPGQVFVEVREIALHSLDLKVRFSSTGESCRQDGIEIS